MDKHVALWLLAVIAFLFSADMHAENRIESDVAEASAGYFQLKWQTTEPASLVESSTAQFKNARVVYEGPDTARVVSGKPDGHWYYRLEATATGEVLTEPLLVIVRHHPLERAFAFFGLGAFVFLATLVLIVSGS